MIQKLELGAEDSDVSSPRTANRGPSQVERSRGFVTTNQGPDSGQAGQWEEREQGRLPDATPPPPPAPSRVLTGGRREEGGGGTYLADPGGGSYWRDL